MIPPVVLPRKDSTTLAVTVAPHATSTLGTILSGTLLITSTWAITRALFKYSSKSSKLYDVAWAVKGVAKRETRMVLRAFMVAPCFPVLANYQVQRPRTVLQHAGAVR